MTKQLEFYKCNVCGNLIQVLVSGNGELTCCDEQMKLIVANSQENVKGEYHLPVKIIENEEEFIQVGEEKHPMTPEHHIEFIQAVSECGKKVFTYILEKDEIPQIKIDYKNFGKYKVKEHCNLHGLWENELE